MKRTLRDEELHLWHAVLATVRPRAGRRTPVAPKPPPLARPVPAAAMTLAAPQPPPGRPRRPVAPPATAPEGIEPGRRRRIVREREGTPARLDLHGLDQDRARLALHGFLLRQQAEGARAVLVITGKGTRGDGVLRRHAPEWLADPVLRGVVAGVSTADRRHGGDGALYVALKKAGR